MVEYLREIFAQQPALALSTAGLVIGIAFGALVERTGFCAMGGVSDAVMLSDSRRLKSWFLAAAVAIIGVLLLDAGGVTDFGKSRYLSAPIDWVGNIFGGVLFGIGMGLAGGCVSKNIVRAGAGDLRALIVVGVVAFFAVLTLSGLLGPLRAALSQATQVLPQDIGAASPALPALIKAASPLLPEQTTLIVGLAVAAAVIWYAFSDPAFRHSPRHIVSGIGIGLCATAGWAVTGLAFDELALTPQPPTSLSFVGPAADTFEWMRRSSALSAFPGFAVAAVIGTLLGSFASAGLGGRLQLATFADSQDTVRNLSGAALMGTGGVLAQGCTIGQAVVGTSTLAVGSFVTFASMIAGTFVVIKLLQRWG